MKTQTQKPHLSVSQLDTMSRCGEQYRRRYIEGEIIPPGIALIVGSSTDRAVTCDLQNKIDCGELLPDEAVADIARDRVDLSIQGGVLLSPEEALAGIKAVKGEAIDKAVRLSRLHHKKLAPSLNPTDVQRGWRLNLDGYPRDLVGFIDVQEGLDSVRDTKTAGKSPAADAAHTSDQLTMYAMACLKIDGEIPRRLFLDYLVDNKTPKLVTLETSRTEADFASILARVETALLALDKGVFVPARQTDWWCNRRFCGYADSCKYFRGSVQI